MFVLSRIRFAVGGRVLAAEFVVVLAVSHRLGGFDFVRTIPGKEEKILNKKYSDVFFLIQCSKTF